MSDFKEEALVNIVGPVSRETFDKLLSFESIFLKWNQRVNLSSSTTETDFWNRHILDCAQLLMYARDKCSSWVDLGSGGGLPGMVIAILLSGQNDCEVFLVESNRKKTAFLHSVSQAVGIKPRILSMRIEDIMIHVKHPDVISARALAPLPRLLEMSHYLFGDHTKALFQKGRGYRREIEESRRNWYFDLIEHQSAMDSDSVILEISNPVEI